MTMLPRRRPETPVGMGEADIPYDRSGGMGQGISGIPDATGGLKSMKLDFADAAQQAPQIPPGAGVPPSGMEGGIPPAGMQAPPQQEGQQSPMLAGMGGPPSPQGLDSSMLSDQDLMAMQGGMDDYDPAMEQGDQMFNGMMDPMNPQAQDIQQQLLLAARRGMGGF